MPKESVTTVHLLRHGKVQNPSDILYGLLPGYHLAQSGRAMAQGVADYLCGPPASGGPVDIAYLAASRLDRAQETAAPLAAATGLPIVTDDRLIEAANSFEGTRFTASTLKSPANLARLRNPALPSWGEPYLQIARRMLGAVYAAEQVARGRVAVLVSHQLPIWTLRRFLEGKRLWHNPAGRQCALASLTTLIFAGGVLDSIHYSEPVAHIAGVNDPAGTPA
nr:histidine phosphatase family protein [Nakamurella lactea]